MTDCSFQSWPQELSSRIFCAKWLWHYSLRGEDDFSGPWNLPGPGTALLNRRQKKWHCARAGILFFFFSRFYFLQQFEVHRKIKHKVQRCPIHPLAPSVHTGPDCQHCKRLIPERWPGALVVGDEPELTHRHHLESAVYITVIVVSWCCVKWLFFFNHGVILGLDNVY